jgi:predicted transcriptional regulator YdeE
MKEKPEGIELSAFHVVGLQVSATWKDLWVVMPEKWKEFIARHEEIPNRKADPFLDISLDKQGPQYIQMICSEVSETSGIPDGMVGLTIPSQKYVHYRHVGPAAGIAESFGLMYDWAKENGITVDGFKVDKGYAKEGKENEHDLYIRMTNGE